MTFTWIDWIITAIVIVSALISLKRGFFKEVLSLLTWIAALFIAWSFGGSLSLYLNDFIETPSLRLITASVLLFIATLLVGGLVNKIFATLVQATGLTGTDRLLGMVFGALRGCLMVILLVGLMSFAPLEDDLAWKNSALLPHFMMLADWSKQTVMQIVSPVMQTTPATSF
ncbi:colicin V production CvpA [Endozoicomonas montiporae]|uniref:Colicin V production CvpA n=2 Tax=Endozoicomonas montiporae TaxID=1027273 RepID=A0A081NAM1_9GAMM|nr:CvpA family protein [Endozoicomonas montiporae]AMO56824.1 CvpA family protein [Endozoicomonas montiporae CL-33]KEQ15494.1 colicin V production CvpA [Endozoicomonas montiporae]